PAPDRVVDLVGLLDRVGRDRLEALLEVPGAATLRIAQARHDVEQAVDRGHGRGRLAARRHGPVACARPPRRISVRNAALALAAVLAMAAPLALAPTARADAAVDWNALADVRTIELVTV